MDRVYLAFGKRLLDIVVSATLLAVAAPVLASLALLVWRHLGRPVLFRQLRPGRDGRPFRVLKFRTMSDARDAEGNLLPDDVRLGRLGRFLRTWSLDELPQLVNVLRGDMSLIGPRPLRMAYLGRYNPRQARRHEVKPGLTGWSQVHGRNALNWEERLALDVWYVDHRCLYIDLKILMMTVAIVLRRKGINAAGHSTMPEFTGSLSEHGGMQ